MQKIVPYLWFVSQAEEAMRFLTAQFDDSGVESIQRYPDGPLEGPMQGMEGKVLHGVFRLAGQHFMALDGGPYFRFNPSISFFVSADTEAETDRLWQQLGSGGRVLMELGEYPFSKKFGWLEDRFGISWQISLGSRPQKIAPFLMFVGNQNGKAEEAIRFYMSLFEQSQLVSLERYAAGEPGAAGTVRHALFRLAGQEFMAIDGGEQHDFSFNEAISFYVECGSQAEVDHFWNQLSADPQAEQCGWLKDRYGVSWQIIPTRLGELIQDPDPEKSKRVMDAMLQMKKIDIAGLEKAYMG
jgi:predicted 3-demethylubiquinone-9 3-methyltransferase (glyoxalase superfamily)